MRISALACRGIPPYEPRATDGVLWLDPKLIPELKSLLEPPGEAMKRAGVADGTSWLCISPDEPTPT